MDFDLVTGRAVLDRTPRVLRALLTGLPEAWTRANEGPGTWTPHEVVCHLINGERTNWVPRGRIILARDSRATFPPFDREGFFAEGRSLPLAELLDTFATLRSDNLRELESWRLGPRELDFEAQHPELGHVTMRELLASWVVHDLGHVAQITRTMARQYRQAVGPWSAYMGVLGASASAS